MIDNNQFMSINVEMPISLQGKDAYCCGICVTAPSVGGILATVDKLRNSSATTVTMPCGERVSLDDVEAREYQKPCPCGDPKHILIKVKTDKTTEVTK